MSPLVRLLAIALLLGTALLGFGAAVHPVLAGTAADQLRLIAATPHWRGLHLVMLAGTGLVIAGIWVRLLLDQSGMPGAVLAALALVALGLGINGLNIAFMAGSGWHMAMLYQHGVAEQMAAVFDVTHPIGLMAARFGNFLVALGALTLGWAEWQDGSRPRWLAALAWLAAAGGIVGVLFFDEASRHALAAVALLSGWQVATGLHALIGTRYTLRQAAAFTP
ncbi:MAG: hypothetical protein M3336_13940 [Chloroflexota bacterium]|nr:hypothetical protein [Chloroflexota bacterium]